MVNLFITLLRNHAPGKNKEKKVIIVKNETQHEVLLTFPIKKKTFTFNKLFIFT